MENGGACLQTGSQEGGWLQKETEEVEGGLCKPASGSKGSFSLLVGFKNSLSHSAFLPSCLPGPDAEREAREGAGHSLQVVAAPLGYGPLVLIGRFLALSAPRKGGPKTATRKVRQPWTRGQEPEAGSGFETGGRLLPSPGPSYPVAEPGGLAD